jgi:hypothetical protein
MSMSVQLLLQITTIWQDANMIALMGVIAVVVTGVATIVTTIVVTFYALRKQQNHKEISCRVRDDTPVIANKNAMDKITVLLNGHPVTDLHLVTLGVWNSGNVSVKVQDYIHPIVFTFPGRKVQDADIQKRNPNSLITEEDAETFLDENIKLRQKQESSVKLPTIHMNPASASGSQNSYIIRVLLTGPEGPAQIDGMLNEGRVVNYDSQNGQSKVRHAWFIITNSVAFLLSQVLS